MTYSVDDYLERVCELEMTLFRDPLRSVMLPRVRFEEGGSSTELFREDLLVTKELRPPKPDSNVTSLPAVKSLMLAIDRDIFLMMAREEDLKRDGAGAGAAACASPWPPSSAAELKRSPFLLLLSSAATSLM